MKQSEFPNANSIQNATISFLPIDDKAESGNRFTVVNAMSLILNILIEYV